MSERIEGWREWVAADLDGLESVPDDVLADAVRRHGTCGWLDTCGQVPAWSGDDRADRELTAPICAGCPVQRECLEWDLRTAGGATSGVWGPLAAEDRQAVWLAWLDRREDGDRA